MQRPCDFEERRKHLAELSDEELKERFWELAREIVKPLYDLAYTHTSPSIERSVLLRMGFSSLEAQSIVSSAEKRGLLGKGAGNIVLTFAKARGIDYLQAGKQLASGSGWDEVVSLFGGGASQ
ncbi:MAG: ornithine aminomutase subunit alpha [Bacillota bacterium]|jgi:D-ornithine 4,5-aminomutase subunit alpha|nr:ornithine aminomutase [Candidatus Fermentithermobacillaceae bacterium]HAF66500.1 ornithine aminomutase [Clostridiales bacterium UBA9857]HOA70906.1 ornithine aminomutase subunit alpha [Bacillota bacterium]HOP70337.1 ornithine aminomutase subunit alpha [Bacillota bacterium]HPT35559.1 ornithine aminomutase subunit alpha [Bacillota bacterium]